MSALVKLLAISLLFSCTSACKENSEARQVGEVIDDASAIAIQNIRGKTREHEGIFLCDSNGEIDFIRQFKNLELRLIKIDKKSDSEAVKIGARYLLDVSHVIEVIFKYCRLAKNFNESSAIIFARAGGPPKVAVDVRSHLEELSLALDVARENSFELKRLSADINLRISQVILTSKKLGEVIGAEKTIPAEIWSTVLTDVDYWKTRKQFVRSEAEKKKLIIDDTTSNYIGVHICSLRGSSMWWERGVASATDKELRYFAACASEHVRKMEASYRRLVGEGPMSRSVEVAFELAILLETLYGANKVPNLGELHESFDVRMKAHDPFFTEVRSRLTEYMFVRPNIE